MARVLKLPRLTMMQQPLRVQRRRLAPQRIKPKEPTAGERQRKRISEELAIASDVVDLTTKIATNPLMDLLGAGIKKATQGDAPDWILHGEKEPETPAEPGAEPGAEPAASLEPTKDVSVGVSDSLLLGDIMGKAAESRAGKKELERLQELEVGRRYYSAIEGLDVPEPAPETDAKKLLAAGEDELDRLRAKADKEGERRLEQQAKDQARLARGAAGKPMHRKPQAFPDLLSGRWSTQQELRDKGVPTPGGFDLSLDQAILSPEQLTPVPEVTMDFDEWTPPEGVADTPEVKGERPERPAGLPTLDEVKEVVTAAANDGLLEIPAVRQDVEELAKLSERPDLPLSVQLESSEILEIAKEMDSLDINNAVFSRDLGQSIDLLDDELLKKVEARYKDVEIPQGTSKVKVASEEKQKVAIETKKEEAKRVDPKTEEGMATVLTRAVEVALDRVNGKLQGKGVEMVTVEVGKDGDFKVVITPDAKKALEETTDEKSKTEVADAVGWIRNITKEVGLPASIADLVVAELTPSPEVGAEVTDFAKLTTEQLAKLTLNQAREYKKIQSDLAGYDPLGTLPTDFNALLAMAMSGNYSPKDRSRIIAMVQYTDIMPPNYFKGGGWMSLAVGGWQGPYYDQIMKALDMGSARGAEDRKFIQDLMTKNLTARNAALAKKPTSFDMLMKLTDVMGKYKQRESIVNANNAKAEKDRALANKKKGNNTRRTRSGGSGRVSKLAASYRKNYGAASVSEAAKKATQVAGSMLGTVQTLMGDKATGLSITSIPESNRVYEKARTFVLGLRNTKGAAETAAKEALRRQGIKDEQLKNLEDATFTNVGATATTSLEKFKEANSALKDAESAFKSLTTLKAEYAGVATAAASGDSYIDVKNGFVDAVPKAKALDALYSQMTAILPTEVADDIEREYKKAVDKMETAGYIRPGAFLQDMENLRLRLEAIRLEAAQAAQVATTGRPPATGRVLTKQATKTPDEAGAR